MSSTDDRIVRMQFDNKTFMKGASDTGKALADVNKAVDGAGSTRGLMDLNTQMSTVGVTASKMAIVTTTALATITNKAVNAGIGMAKALTLDPITQGFQEYEELLTKQNTIMNATGESSKVVKGYLSDLNTYSDKTIYSFGDMTASIVKFVNAGISLPQSVKSIQGIANSAAFAGASTQEASRAMYAFSQSMGTGYLMLNDWMQIENANMGTIQFKETLLEAAEAAGTLTKKGDGYLTQTGKYVSATKGWREGLQEQWATTEVMNKALAKYTDLNTKLGREATESATEIRTFTAFMDTLKESIGSGWSVIFTALIGNLQQATKFWTNFGEVTSSVVGGFFDFAAAALQTWRQMGGFEKTLQGISNILAPFKALLGAIGDAWRQAFPDSGSGAGKALYGLSAGFELLTRPLAWLAKGIPAITPVLATLFKVVAAGGSAVGGVIGTIMDLVRSLSGLVELKMPSTGGLLGFVKQIPPAIQAALSKIDELLSKGSSLGSIFSGVDIELPGMPSLSGAFSGGAEVQAASASAGDAVSGMGSAMSTLSDIAVKMGEIFKNLWNRATDFFSGLTMDDVVASFNMAILSTMAISISRFFNTLTKSFKGFGGIGEGVENVLGATENALKSFQTAARAKLILNIAIAIGVLAASLWVLSRIDPEKLATGLGAMGVMFVMLNLTMKQFSKTMETMENTGSVKMLAFSAAVVALAFAMGLLAVAMLLMNKVEWTSIIKGLVTMGVTMKVMEALGNTGKFAAKNMVAGAAAIVLIAGAMIVLAGALLLFKLVDWGAMAKAGATLTAVSLAVGLLALIPYAGIAKVGLALLGASVGMLAMANALIIFALVEWESIAKAAVVLGALTLSLAVLMAVGGPVASASLLILAASLVAVAGACLMLNYVDWESIGKASVILLALLAAAALGATIMTLFLYAIAPVSPVLVAIGLGFALVGLGLLAFAAAMTIAVALAAAGTAAFAALATGAAVAVGVFFQTLALQAPVMSKSVLKILQAMIDTVVKAVPMIIKGFKDLWKAIMKEMQSGDKKKSFGDIVEDWLDRLTDAARRYIPKLVNLGLEIVLQFLNALKRRAGEFSGIGIDFLEKLIKGIGTKMGKLTDTATDMVIKLAKGLKDNATKMINAGIDMIAEFLHDLADAIRGGSSKIGAGIQDVIDAMQEVGGDMVDGLTAGVRGKLGDATSAIGGLASSMLSKARGILKIKSPSRVFMDIGKFLVQGLTKGIQNNAASAIVATASMITGAIAIADEYVSKYMQKLDQQAIAARARAQGLARAAATATKSANRTKDKGDNKAAKALSDRAKKAAKIAAKEEREAKKARQAQARRDKWEESDSAQRAEIRAQQAQSQLAGAKAAERDAEAARIQANALREQAKKAGTPAERKKLLKEAEKLRKQAREDAQRANKLIKNASNSAASALVWQKKAGEEAAEAFQKQYDAEAQADADADAFERLSDTEKAAKRREQAAELQAKADERLRKAKEIAMTDLDKANEMAQQALAEAEQARQFLDEAAGYAGGSTNEVVSLDQSDAAALAFNDYADLYDSAYAAAAGAKQLIFNQNNYSPESLSDAEIYRQTNNQLTFANDKLAEAAA